MKRMAKQIAIDSLTNAIRAIEMIYAEDVKARKKATRRSKKKWTKSLNRLTFILRAMKATRHEARKIGGRV